MVRFFASDDKGALAEGLHADKELGSRASTSLWIAGLAAWRLGPVSPRPAGASLR